MLENDRVRIFNRIAVSIVVVKDVSEDDYGNIVGIESSRYGFSVSGNAGV